MQNVSFEHTYSEAQLVGSEAGLCTDLRAASSQDPALRGSEGTHPWKVQTDLHPEFCIWTSCTEGEEVCLGKRKTKHHYTVNYKDL